MSRPRVSVTQAQRPQERVKVMPRARRLAEGSGNGMVCIWGLLAWVGLRYEIAALVVTVSLFVHKGLPSCAAFSISHAL